MAVAPCTAALAEASGIAARQVVGAGVPFAQIDVQQLRQRLRQVGAIVDESELPEIKPRVDQS